VDDGSAEAKALDQSPGLLLIDPWILAQPTGPARLRAALASAPEWVTPLIVANRDDPQFVDRGATLSNDALVMLSQTGSQRSQDPRAASIAHDVEKFDQLMPTVIGHTRRRYLRLRPGATRSGAASGRPWRTDNEPAPRQSRKKNDD
jgi:FxsC-like protein